MCVICLTKPVKGHRLTCGPSCAVKLAIRNYEASGRKWKTPEPAHKWNKEDLPNQWGERNTNWKGGKKKTHGGYVEVLAPFGYPHPTKHRYVMEHRLVMERHLGRYLEAWEFVHHRNGVKNDNRVENLVLVTKKTHLGKVVCPHCHQEFSIR
jgi:hypothetical protein